MHLLSQHGSLDAISYWMNRTSVTAIAHSDINIDMYPEIITKEKTQARVRIACVFARVTNLCFSPIGWLKRRNDGFQHQSTSLERCRTLIHFAECRRCLHR